MRMRESVAVLGALVALGVQTASAQTAEQVVDRHLAAIGGRDALMKLRSRQANGTIVVSSPIGELSGTIEILNATPNKARTLIQIDAAAVGAGLVVIDQRFDGVAGYVMDSMQGNRDITGGQLETMRAGAFPNVLLNYKQLGANISLGEKQKVGDRDVFVLVYEPTSGSAVRHFIDAETYMELQAVVKVDIPQLGGEVEQTTSFGDYRDVDGVKVPFQIKSSSTVQNFAVTMSKVEHNVTIDPALFTKPAK